MRRIVLFLSVAAVVAAMLAASALPALANERNDNDRHDNNIVRIGDNDRHDHLDNRLERRIDRFDFFDDGFAFFPFVDDDVADELCSPLNSDAVNDLVPGCIFD